MGSLVCVGVFASSTAHANGVEVPENGALAVGRGGAVVARPSDPSTIMHNTAGMVGLPGFQFVVSSNFGILNHCFQRAGTYGSEAMNGVTTVGTAFETSRYNSGGVRYPETCNEFTPAIAPQLLATFRIFPNLTVGLGVYAPHATGREQRFPDRVMTPMGLAPSPVRYLLYEKALLALHPTIAIAWAPVPWLRFGGAIQPSFASFSFTTMVNTNTVSPQSPSNDIRITLNTAGWFFAGNLSAQIIPNRYLSIGIHSHLNAPFEASGQAEAIANYYYTNPMDQARSSFQIVRQTVALPWTIRGGVRFALPRAGHPVMYDPQHVRPNNFAEGRNFGNSYDPMRDDVFDIEADFTYEHTSTLGTVRLDNMGDLDIGGGIMQRAPTPITLDSGYVNTFGARLGGDFNAIPGVLAFRAGFAFESGPQNPANFQVHVPAYDSFSVHAGGTFRWGPIAISLGYAHYFFLPMDNSTTGGARVIGAMGRLTDQQCASGVQDREACTVNRGTFRASYDLLGLAIAGRF